MTLHKFWFASGIEGDNVAPAPREFRTKSSHIARLFSEATNGEWRINPIYKLRLFSTVSKTILTDRPTDSDVPHT